MTHISPAVFGVWSVCCVLLTTFCLYHIWHYDRFKCLRVNHGPYSGAFKRLMAYTYILSLPLITIYSVGNAVIKYQEGFVVDSRMGAFPKPHSEWTKAHQDAIFPLIMIYSISTSLEMATHLEELCFWMFLMNATASSQDWFRSIYFLIWSCGSVVALIYVPIVSVISRHDPLKNEAYTFLAGGAGSLVLTLFFVPILYSFPAFMRNLAKKGIDKATTIRLRKFHELNCLRIVFRLLFVLPLVALGIDGTKPHSHPLNESMFWTDILGIIAAFGCIVSSAITILIFFPRNENNEYNASGLARLGRLETPKLKGGYRPQRGPAGRYSERNSPELAFEPLSDSRADSQYPLKSVSMDEMEDPGCGALPRCQPLGVRNNDEEATVGGFTPSASAISNTPLRPNRLGPNGDIELGCVQDPSIAGGWVSNWTSQFRSPLDVMQPCAY